MLLSFFLVMAKLYFFDFDGCLAIPYTNPEQPYTDTIKSLHHLFNQGHIICVISCNPRAVTVLKQWNVIRLCSAIRAGCNWNWKNELYQDEIHRVNMNKASMIRNILDNELNDIIDVWHECHFYDDDMINIDIVQQYFPQIQCHFVDNVVGYKT